MRRSGKIYFPHNGSARKRLSLAVEALEFESDAYDNGFGLLQRIWEVGMSVGKDFIGWLLASPTPSIRHAAMTKLLGRGAENSQVLAERNQIMRRGPVPVILEGQTSNGSWQPERSYYTPKYTSTHWSMLLLAELNVDGRDPRAQRGVEYMLSETEAEVREQIVRKGHGLSCFWGNLIRYALHCGFSSDPRLSVIIDYMLRDALEWQWRCRHNWGHPCAWGAARSLWGLALLPLDMRTREVEEAIQKGLDFLLAGEKLIQADFPRGGGVHRIWSRLNFPLFYQADILFVLRMAADHNALAHPGARAALDWLAARRQRNRRWRGASPFRQRTWHALSDAGDVNRWVSLHAAHVLRPATG